MDSTIIAAIITAVAVIIAAIIGFVKKEEISLLFKSTNRCWSGLWKGKATVIERDMSYEFSGEFKQYNKKVKGKLITSEPESLIYDFVGYIHESEYLSFFAKNEKGNVLNYSVGILRLTREGNIINGEYLARSRFAEDVSHGIIEMQKVN